MRGYPNSPCWAQMNGVVMAAFTYDGDVQRVKQALNGVTTTFVGKYYQVTGSSVTTFGGRRVAMRQGSAVYWLQSHSGRDLGFLYIYIVGKRNIK